MQKTRNPWLIVGVFMYCAAISAFNETILNVAYRAIAEDLNITVGTAQWLTTGFMLVTSVMVPVSAFLFLSIPTRRLFILSLGVICVGTVGCLVAPNFITLLIFRMVVSAGNGMIVPMMMNVTLMVAPKEHLGVAMAMCASAITMGPAFAPVVSGLMLQFFQWRAIFALMLILALIGLIVGVFVVEDSAELTHPKLDILSVILSTAGLALFLYGINILFDSLGKSLVFIVIGVVILAWFVIRQSQLEEPLLNFSPFRIPVFTAGIVLVCFAMLVNFSMSVLTPTFLQGTLGVSDLLSGALLIPAVLLNVISTSYSGRILDKHGVRVMIPTAFVVTAIGLFLMSHNAMHLTILTFVLIYIFLYQGLAFSMSPSQTTTLAILPKELHAHGVSIVNTMIQISASLGSALFGGILSTVQTGELAAGATEAVAIGHGYMQALTVAIPISLAGFVVSFVAFRKVKTVKA